MAIHPAIVLTCDGYQRSERLALIGPNAVSYHGARGHAESYGWDCSADDVDWGPAAGRRRRHSAPRTAAFRAVLALTVRRTCCA